MRDRTYAPHCGVARVHMTPLGVTATFPTRTSSSTQVRTVEWRIPRLPIRRLISSKLNGPSSRAQASWMMFSTTHRVVNLGTGPLSVVGGAVQASSRASAIWHICVYGVLKCFVWMDPGVTSRCSGRALRAAGLRLGQHGSRGGRHPARDGQNGCCPVGPLASPSAKGPSFPGPWPAGGLKPPPPIAPPWSCASTAGAKACGSARATSSQAMPNAAACTATPTRSTACCAASPRRGMASSWTSTCSARR